MKPTGQGKSTSGWRDNETLAEAIKRYEWGKLTEKLIKGNIGRIRIEKEPNEPKV